MPSPATRSAGSSTAHSPPRDAVRLDAPDEPPDEARSCLRPPPARKGRRGQLEPLGGERGLRTGPVPGHQLDPRRAGAWTPSYGSWLSGGTSLYSRTLGDSITRSFTGRAIALVGTKSPRRGRRGSTSTARWRRRSTSADPPPPIARSCSPAPGRRRSRTPSASSCSARRAGRGWTWTPSSSSRRRDQAGAPRARRRTRCGRVVESPSRSGRAGSGPVRTPAPRPDGAVSWHARCGKGPSSSASSPSR